jgi:hypothetical protein
LAAKLVEVPLVACVPGHGYAVNLQEVRRLDRKERRNRLIRWMANAECTMLTISRLSVVQSLVQRFQKDVA